MQLRDSSMVGRRAAASLLVLAPVVGAQQPGLRRVAYLGSGYADPSTNLDAFREGLRERGWVVGRDIEIVTRFAQGKFDRLPSLARELVRMNPQVIVAGPTPPAFAARDATRTIPIVFWGVADPVTVGLVQSAARPGGNATGLAFVFGMEFYGKGLQLLKEAVPGVRRVALLVNAANPGQKPALEALEATAGPLGLSLQVLLVRDAAEFDGPFATMTRERADAVYVAPDSLFGFNAMPLAELAARHRLPSMFGTRANAEAGGLMSYGSNIANHNRQAAAFVDRILKGASPSELPVEQPTKFELVVNLRTARALGVSIPKLLLVRADEVIE